MSFGTAETLEDIPAYLSSVRAGRPVPDELLTEMQRRFALVGGSPLTRISREQAAALEAQLNDGGNDPTRFRVEIGMRHAPPFIADGVAQLLERGAGRILGLVLSPQYSPIIMGAYLRGLDAAMNQHPGLQFETLGSWHDEPAFLDALAQRTREALDRLPPGERDTVRVFFTAHSLPRSVADGEPAYIQALHDTARWVAERVGLPAERWQWAYQSAGHTPDPWLTPDVKDLLPELRSQGHTRTLVVPVQFLADHMEVLYDIDVAAKEEAAALGITLERTESLNTMPLFIEAMANVVRRPV
jgi:ferrochelatase